jgi:predicted MFS family arabinose efflux permease
MPRGSSGLLVTLPLIGYGVGLLFVVPLGDLIENRRLVLMLLGLETLCLLVIGRIDQPVPFLAVAFLVGATAVAVQVLVPYVTYLVPLAIRGRTVGKVMSGLMLGIMLARPLSSLMADLFSWRAIFNLSAALMAALFVTLRLALPPRQPARHSSYTELLRSMGRIYLTTPVLRRRALYHACMFGAFSVFWTAAPLWLSGPQFQLTQRGIAWVALAGVAGAIAPPIAGRIADSGLSSGAERIGARARPGDRLRHRARLRRFRKPGIRATGHLCARPGAAQSPQRTLHGDLFRRRRNRLGAGRLVLRAPRLAGRICGGHRAAGAGSLVFFH